MYILKYYATTTVAELNIIFRNSKTLLLPTLGQLLQIKKLLRHTLVSYCSIYNIRRYN